MSETRQHPDLFTALEAIVYLHLEPDNSERTLKTLRDVHQLAAYHVGKELMYHRDDLDACVARLFRKTTKRPTALRLTGDSV